MLDVPDIQSIRVMTQRGIPIREIARLLRVSRKTVRKYAAPGYVVAPKPKQDMKKPRRSPQMDRWKPMLTEWVAHDEKEPRKQRRTARRMHEQLVEEHGANVSEASVRRFVGYLRGARVREAYVPLKFAPGSMMQVDFGHADVIIAGQRRTLPFIAARLMASTVSFVKTFGHAKLEAWMDGINSALSFFGGVPAQATFDNDSTLVVEILAGGRRLQTPEFRALAAHYGCEAVFANPRRGNEKGGVEHLVQWAQRNLFSPVPEAGSLGELNERLSRQCLRDAERRRRDGRLVSDLWEAEQPHLGTLPPVPFAACRRRFARVDKTLLVAYDGVRYSVPADYAQKPLLLRAFWDRIEIADGERTVAVHDRRVSVDAPSLQLEHYLPVLARKPRAVTHAAVIAHGAPEVARYRDEFLRTRPEAVREMVAILGLTQEVGLPALSAALAVASRHHAYDIESVRAVMAMGADRQTRPPLAESLLQRWPEAPVQAVDPAAYAWLTETAAGGEAE
jgi:transposase